MSDLKWTRVGRDIMAETANHRLYIDNCRNDFCLCVTSKNGFQFLKKWRKRQRECKELAARLMEILEDED